MFCSEVGIWKYQEFVKYGLMQGHGCHFQKKWGGYSNLLLFSEKEFSCFLGFGFRFWVWGEMGVWQMMYMLCFFVHKEIHMEYGVHVALLFISGISSVNRWFWILALVWEKLLNSLATLYFSFYNWFSCSALHHMMKLLSSNKHNFLGHIWRLWKSLPRLIFFPVRKETASYK